ncbi:hypothetical protein SSCHL_0591 [Staphylococcus schleiferi]|nr:hypothetical protein SSCHL_0591 [Staphylococcus schleiferi]
MKSSGLIICDDIKIIVVVILFSVLKRFKQCPTDALSQ